MQSAEMSLEAKPKQTSFIEGTGPDVARRRGEEILGLPVVKGKTWVVTAIISPSEAKQILLAMPRQRPLYPSEVAKFKRLILSGQFKQTHQGVAFDTEGFLFDGQHRMHACIEADAAIEVQVTFNLDRELFDCLDRGRTRSLTDDLITSARTDDPHMARMICQGAKILTNLDRELVPWTNFKRGDFGVSEIAAAMKAHPHIIEAAEFCLKNRGNFRGLGTGVAVGFLTAFMEINPDKALSFFAEIALGELLMSGDPAYEMRELMRKPGASSPAFRPRTMSGLVRCWNAYVEGRKLSKVYTDTFPAISRG